MSGRRLIIGLFLASSFCAGCSKDVTKDPRISWFAPGKEYTIEQDVVLRYGALKKKDEGMLRAELTVYREHPKSELPKWDIVTKGTVVKLAWVEQPSFDLGYLYYARIHDGPLKGKEVKINDILKVDSLETSNGLSQLNYQINEEFLIPADTASKAGR